MRVGEEPLVDALSRGTKSHSETSIPCGRVTIINERSEETRLGYGHTPWRLGKPTERQIKLHKAGLAIGYKDAVLNAYFDKENRVGMISGEQGQKVLMVKLSDECDHNASHWKETPCGHHWCARCDGHVDPRTRVALKGPGPIIKCNRISLG